MSAFPTAGGYPRCRPVAAHGVLVEFGETIDEATHARVRQLDRALQQAPMVGFLEAVPAYCNLMVCFDPLVTDHEAVTTAVGHLLARGGAARSPGTPRQVEVCYDGDLAPDLGRVAEASGLSPEAVVAAHLSGRYTVYMYGFAPGYAYLAGVPPEIQLPRKNSAVRGVPAGSVLIAGPQCLVTTLTMPTGWFVIGRSATPILADDPERPFLFDVGDAVAFRRVARDSFETAAGIR